MKSLFSFVMNRSKSFQKSYREITSEFTSFETFDIEGQ